MARLVRAIAACALCNRMPATNAGADRYIYAEATHEALNGRDQFRRHHHRLGAGRLCLRHPRGAARFQDRHRRARLFGRHLPELGLHPDQGAVALGGDFPLPAARQGLRAVGRRGHLRSGRRGEALARGVETPQRRRRLPDEEEQGFGDLGRGGDRRARQDHRESRQERSAERRARRRAPIRPSTSSSPPARGRACCRASSRTRN